MTDGVREGDCQLGRAIEQRIMITNYVPGAPRDSCMCVGAEWLIDGVSIPNTNIATGTSR